MEEPVVMATLALALAVRVLKNGGGDLAVEGGVLRSSEGVFAGARSGWSCFAE